MLSFLEDYKNEIDITLDTYFAQHKSLNQDTPESNFWQAVEYAVSNGGKRFRPILALCFYELGSQPISSRAQVLEILCSLEFMHAYSLVHDDLPCIDNDKTRRGAPTVWHKFGDGTAVLVGDALQTMAFENLAQKAPESALPILLKTLATGAGTTGMLMGQVRDIAFENQTITLEALETTHRLKTGALIKMSALWGGILGGISNSNALTQYADLIGLLFQIKDDLLDFEGQAKTVGKAVGKDEKGYVYTLGAEPTKLKLKALETEAKALAKKLKAPKLAALVDFICTRSH